MFTFTGEPRPRYGHGGKFAACSYTLFSPGKHWMEESRRKLRSLSQDLRKQFQSHVETHGANHISSQINRSA